MTIDTLTLFLMVITMVYLIRSIQKSNKKSQNIDKKIEAELERIKRIIHGNTNLQLQTLYLDKMKQEVPTYPSIPFTSDKNYHDECEKNDLRFKKIINC